MLFRIVDCVHHFFNLSGDCKFIHQMVANKNIIDTANVPIYFAFYTFVIIRLYLILKRYLAAAALRRFTLKVT